MFFLFFSLLSSRFVAEPFCLFERRQKCKQRAHSLKGVSRYSQVLPSQTHRVSVSAWINEGARSPLHERLFNVKKKKRKMNVVQCRMTETIKKHNKSLIIIFLPSLLYFWSTELIVSLIHTLFGHKRIIKKNRYVRKKTWQGVLFWDNNKCQGCVIEVLAGCYFSITTHPDLLFLS